MKPMLASPAPVQINFPVFASAKIDGVRALGKDAICLSRSLKPIPNRYIQDVLGKDELNGLDGELTVGPPNAKNTMQATTSGVMTQDGQPDFTWWVFDYWNNPNIPYGERFRNLLDGISHPVFQQNNHHVKLLPASFITSQEQLDQFESEHVNAGFEGIMIRSPNGIYKYGRSTAREGHLLKLKRFKDGEAVVIGFEERMHNANEATLDERGYTARSSHKENLIPMNTLGALIVRDCKTGIEFGIGTGFQDVERKYIWDLRQSYVGLIVVYKHFETGVKVAPRFPVFKGFRDKRDM